MSHDRGCFKCGRDPWYYDACEEKDCVKAPWVKACAEEAKAKETAMMNPHAVQKTSDTQKTVSEMLKLAAHRLGRTHILSSSTDGQNEFEKGNYQDLIRQIHKCFPEETKNYFEKSDPGPGQTTNYR